MTSSQLLYSLFQAYHARIEYSEMRPLVLLSELPKLSPIRLDLRVGLVLQSAQMKSACPQRPQVQQ